MVTFTSEPYSPNQLYSVPLAELQPDPNQPRKYLDPQALDELTASVAQVGILQPVIARQDRNTGLLYVVAGERRCAAARKAGLTHVPTLFINTENYSEIALVENVIRQDLNPVEEAEALKRLMDDHGYKQEDLARIISKAPVTVSETLSLNKLPKEIRDECRQDPTVPKNVLVTIARSKQQRGMITQYRKFKEQRAKEDAAKPSGTGSRRTPAEALTNTLNTAQQKVAAVDLQSLASADLTLVIEAMTALKNTLEETLSKVPEPGSD